MPKSRARRHLRSPVGAPDDIEAIRTRGLFDLKFFYQSIILDGNPEYQNYLGAFHDLLFDFAHWEKLRGMPVAWRNTGLWKHVPFFGDNGMTLQDRWLYWPTLDSEPEVHDGPDNPLWKRWADGDVLPGVLIRLNGSGSKRCYLLPRGHLKSSIISKAKALQMIARDPAERIFVETAEKPLSMRFLSSVRGVFERNQAFREAYGDMCPTRHEAPWNAEMLQVVKPDDEGRDLVIRRGSEATLTSGAVKAESTGEHYSHAFLDDVVTFKNMKRSEELRQHVMELGFVMDPGSAVEDIGTVYAEDDPHALFVRPVIDEAPNKLFRFTSFMVATLRDVNDKPLWPERFTEEVIEEKRAQCPSDVLWFCQMWQNPYLAKKQKFKREWLRYYAGQTNAVAGDKRIEDGTPEAVARALRLDITMTVDAASTAKKRSDFSACTVRGQDPNTGERYLLDGFYEKFDVTDVPGLPGAIVNLALKWKRLVWTYGGGFKLGVEMFSFAKLLQFPIRDLARAQDEFLEVVELKPHGVAKNDHIAAMQRPYSTGSYLWPRCGIPKQRVDGTEYDLVDVLRGQYLKWPMLVKDDLLDADAYQEVLMSAVPYKAHPQAPAVPADQPGVYRREEEAEPLTQGLCRSGRYMPSETTPTPALARIAASQGVMRRSGRYMPDGGSSPR